MNWEELTSLSFWPPRPCWITSHNSRADKPITSQKATVLTVEFTKALLMKPGSDQPAKPRGSCHQVRCCSDKLDRRNSPRTLFYLFCRKKARRRNHNLSHLRNLGRREVRDITIGLLHGPQSVPYEKGFIHQKSEIIRL